MILLIVTLLVLLADQLTKIWVRSSLSLGESIPIIQNVFHLTYVKNSGAAFGLFPRQRLLFLLAAVLVIAFVIFYYRYVQNEHYLVRLALGLELGGALGNLVDRLIYGRVTDFLDFRVWPVFNLADSAIVVGLVVLAGWVLLSSVRRGSSEGI